MGLFDLFNDVKENVDKSRQAREYIKRAKELIREGDDIYERAYSKVMSYASETEYRLNQHMNYKKEIVKELGGSIGETLRNFKNFNIDSKIAIPSFISDSKVITDSSIKGTSFGLNSFESAMSSCIPQIDASSILDMFISDDDYYEARRQRDEARAYKERMKMARDKLNNYKEKMNEIRSFINSEKTELESLVSKLKKMTDELKSGMQKRSFGMQEAEYLKGIHKIAEYVANLLSTEFLEDGFYINKRYQKAFAGIKNINQNLPYTPSISDTNTLNTIRKIVDGIIVY